MLLLDSTMSSISTEKHYFCSTVERSKEIPQKHLHLDRSFFRSTFFLIKEIHSWHDDPTDITYESLIAATRRTSILITGINHRNGYAEILGRHLSRMGMPREEQPTILEKLFQVVEVAIPMRRVFVLVADVTVRLLGSFDDQDTIDRLTREHPISKQFEFVHELGIEETYGLSEADYHDIHDMVTWESFQTHRGKFIPAFSLEKVRLGSLEEATIKLYPTCVICMDDFADGSADQLVIRLPCANLFHAHCISQWLEVNRVCPLCRYAITKEVDIEPSEIISENVEAPVHEANFEPQVPDKQQLANEVLVPTQESNFQASNLNNVHDNTDNLNATYCEPKCQFLIQC
ncbi:hypothetical protein ACLB2K_054003 [Fragaria x ananassa]